MSVSVNIQKLFHIAVMRCKPPTEKIIICYQGSGLLKVEIRLIWEELKQF